MSRSKLILRLAGLGLAVALLLWFPREDTTENWAVFFAALACAWLAVRFIVRSARGRDQSLLSFMLIGALAGAAVTPAALLLMAFKTGWHAHGVPDYTPSQFLAIITRTPVWAAGGALVGLGAGLMQKG